MSGRAAPSAARDPLEDQRKFGREIRALRVARGQSEEEIAKLAGLELERYRAIERGEQNLTYLTLLAIAAALEVEASEIVQRVEDL
jgi:transcriptional regulator with XRE-family HTH domain